MLERRRRSTGYKLIDCIRISLTCPTLQSLRSGYINILRLSAVVRPASDERTGAALVDVSVQRSNG